MTRRLFVLFVLVLVVSLLAGCGGKKAIPTPPAVSGTELQHVEGNVVFKDYGAGYTMRMSSDDWIAFRPNEDDVQKIVLEAGEVIPGVDAREMERAALNVSKNVKLIALYLKSDPDFMTNFHVTDFSTEKRYSPKDVLSQEKEALSEQIPGVVVKSAEVKRNKNGVEVTELVARFQINTQAKPLEVTELFVTFQPDSHSAVRVVFGMPSRKAKNTLLMVHDIVDGIALMQ